MILVFWMLSFKPTFSLPSFIFKRIFSSSLFSAIRVVSSVYLRLLIFLQAILIPVCDFPAQHFPWCTLHIHYMNRVTIFSLDLLLCQFGIVCCSMSGSNCCFLTCIQNSQEAGSVHFSSSGMSDFLQPHGLQDTCPPCPSPTPGVYSNSCPVSQWCHPTISSFVVPFSSCLQPFKWASSSHQVAKVLDFQLQRQSFQWIYRTDFL